MPHITLAGNFEDPLLPSNIDELDKDAIDEIQNEVNKVSLMRQYLTLVRDINPDLITVMRSEHMEHLQCTLYYSSTLGRMAFLF